MARLLMILLKKLRVGESRVVNFSHSVVSWFQVAALNFSWPFLYGHKKIVVALDIVFPHNSAQRHETGGQP